MIIDTIAAIRRVDNDEYVFNMAFTKLAPEKDDPSIIGSTPINVTYRTYIFDQVLRHVKDLDRELIHKLEKVQKDNYFYADNDMESILEAIRKATDETYRITKRFCTNYLIVNSEISSKLSKINRNQWGVFVPTKILESDWVKPEDIFLVSMLKQDKEDAATIFCFLRGEDEAYIDIVDTTPIQRIFILDSI